MTKMITTLSSGSLTIDFTPDINIKAMYNSLIRIYVNIRIHTEIDLICPKLKFIYFGDHSPLSLRILVTMNILCTLPRKMHRYYLAQNFKRVYPPSRNSLVQSWLRSLFLPCLVQISWLSVILCSERSRVRFQVNAHTQVWDQSLVKVCAAGS